MTVESEDSRLVAAFLRTRDEGAFLDVYRRHTPFLLALARRLLNDGRRVEDVVQETWIRAVRLLPEFRWESTLRTWLGGIVVNCSREERRRWSAHPESSVARHRTAEPDRDARLDLERAIGGLAAELREVVVLHEVAGFTHREIGEQLGIAPGTSKSRLHEARRELIDRLGFQEARSGWRA